MVDMVQGRPARSGVSAVFAAASLLGAVAPAPAAGERAELAVTLSARTPSAPTGLEFLVRYFDPESREGKPPALTAGAFHLPGGLRIDQAAVPRCDATDEEFRVLGRRACPPESQVGSGTLVAMTGLPADPVRTDVTAFNGDGEIVELVTFQGTDRMAGIDRLTVEGSTLRAHPPVTPGGPPDGRTTIREVNLVVPARAGAGGRPFVVAPPACPADGLWRSRGVFAFADGGTASAPATTPCRAGGAPGGDADVAAPAPSAVAPARARPRLRVRLVSPRRVRAGRRTRFTVRVSSAVPSCARRATVRIGRVRTTTDRRGRATLVTRVRRRFAVRVTRLGCAPARLRVGVR
jgi:hypothetical protein